MPADWTGKSEPFGKLRVFLICAIVATFIFMCLVNKSIQVSKRQPLSSSFLTPKLGRITLVPKPGKEEGSRYRHVISVEFAVCGRHPFARGSPPRAPSGAAGHEGGSGTSNPDPRPGAAGGPRAVPELDGPGGSGRGSNPGSGPAHPHAVEQDGSTG